MKTTTFIFLSFFLVLPGQMKLVKSDQRTESEFSSIFPADYSLNLSNHIYNESGITYLSKESLKKENSTIISKPTLRSYNSLLKLFKVGFPFYSEKEFKEDMSLDKWITELNEFNKDVLVFTEDEIQIEEWMMSNLIDTRENNIVPEKDVLISTEDQIQIQRWITVNFSDSRENNIVQEQGFNHERWNENSSSFPVVPEKEIEADPAIEQWMTGSEK
jgi:hypothetical protein